MPRYDYLARSAIGDAVKGQLTAASPSDATRLLRADGKFVVKLKELADVAEDAAAMQISFGSKRIRSDDVIFFISQMAVMVDTGVSITDALDGIIEQCESAGFKKVLQDVLADVETGMHFSDALARHPHVFKPLVVNLVRASEASGKLGTMLHRCAEYLLNQRETRRKVVGAMVYPAFLMVFSLSVAIFLLTFLMPRYTAIYAGKEQVLPTPTKLLINFADGVSTYWMPIVGGMVGVLLLIVLYVRTARGTRSVHWFMLHSPLIGRMFHKALLTRSLRTLGTLIEAGVAMLDAVTITGNVAGNAYFKDMWNEVNSRVEQGEQLSRPLFGYSLMPRGVTQMISAGERSGHLPLVLDRVSDFLDRDLDQAVRRVTSMIEPIMIVFMGGLVGSIAIALLLPIFTLSRVMGK